VLFRRRVRDPDQRPTRRIDTGRLRGRMDGCGTRSELLHCGDGKVRAHEVLPIALERAGSCCKAIDLVRTLRPFATHGLLPR
jgi:hypothetical protein